MVARSLQGRFILAGALLVATAAASGIWCAWTFARLSSAIGEMLRESQDTVDATTQLATILERHDDSLLLALAGQTRLAGRDIAAQRRRFQAVFEQLALLLREAEERRRAESLRRYAERYFAESDALLNIAPTDDAQQRYLHEVNPALRRAVAECSRIRELNLSAMRSAAVRARDVAKNSAALVLGSSAVALGVSMFVAWRLAQAVVRPIRILTTSVEALRLGDFGQRVPIAPLADLAQLGEGFNRMAETLADYRNSSLGELLAAKSALESTLAVLPEAIIVLDPDGRIVSANDLAERFMRGSGCDEPRSLRDLPLPAPLVSAVQETLQNERGGVPRGELGGALTVSLDGQVRKMLPAIAAIPEYLPHRRGAVVMLDDVTDFARLDELRSELVAVASHELKTPLTTLRMNLLLLAERAENLTALQQEMLSAALQGTEELAATIEELLDLTRIEAGQLRLSQERVDVLAVIEQAVRSAGPRFQGAEVGLEVVNEAKSTVVQGDGARLRIVVANLLGNALKYAPRQSRVVVRVSSRQNAGDDDRAGLQIAVTDAGPGVPADYRERVFEKFFRVEHQLSACAAGARGTGIGLYLCRQIIEGHRGRIWCEPGPGGVGTTVAFWMPQVALTLHP